MIALPKMVMVGLWLGLLLSLGVQVQSAEPKRKKSEASAAFFADRKVRLFEIELSPAAMQQLRAAPRREVIGTVREGGQVFTNVGVHIKGMGSFRPLDENPSFVIKFNRVVEDQEYCGMSKLMLNNSVQDQTYLCELIATGLFRDAGLPAARVTHARVMLNGRELGLHVAIEAMNKHFLKRHFKDTSGNLYDGYLRDINARLHQGNGENTSQEDLRRLYSACRIPDLAERYQGMSKVLDVDRFVSFAVMEILINQWDGYTLKSNNFRCYHDPATDKFVFIPYGMDLVFRRLNISSGPPMKSIISRALFETPEGRQLYRDRLRTLSSTVFKYQVITNRMADVLAKLETAQIPALPMSNIQHQVAILQGRIAMRIERISDEMAGRPPPWLKFDQTGIGRPGGWRDEFDRGQPLFDRAKVEGKATLHIKAQGDRCRASWRSLVCLPPGLYSIEGLVRTTGVIGGYATLRISGDTMSTRLTGENSWRLLQHQFFLEDGGDAELVCELNSPSGEAWFDLESLRLRKRTAPLPGRFPALPGLRP